MSEMTDEEISDARYIMLYACGGILGGALVVAMFWASAFLCSR